jgi:hypothetical protein
MARWRAMGLARVAPARRGEPVLGLRVAAGLSQAAGGVRLGPAVAAAAAQRYLRACDIQVIRK